MKAIDNPINRVFVKEGDFYRVCLEINVGEPYIDNYRGNYQRGIKTIEVDYFNSKKEADDLQKRLCEKFGIQIKISKSKIKPVTFAEMVVEE